VDRVRKALLLATVLLLTAVAGCAGPGPLADPDDDEQRTSGGGRTSEGGNSTDPPHDDVVLLDTMVELIGQQTVTLPVSVPANVTVVDFTISAAGPSNAAVFSGLRIELSGCGIYDQGATSSSSGTITLAGRLCKDAASGDQTVTVTNTGFAQANLRLKGQIPKGNSTAPAA
jgi:hypothetical protein